MGVRFLAEQEVFRVSIESILALGSTQLLIQWDSVLFPQGLSDKTTHLHVVPSKRMAELYIHSLIILKV
jgi:hypothetical protein